MLNGIIWNQNTLAIAAGAAISIFAIAAGTWHKTERMRSENDLKRSMVERGMSADDIERVLSLQPPKK